MTPLPFNDLIHDTFRTSAIAALEEDDAAHLKLVSSSYKRILTELTRPEWR